MYRGVAGDLDEITELGCFIVTSENSTHIPSGAYKYGVLEVFGGSAFIGQRYTPHTNTVGNFGEYTRVRYNDTWGSWRFIPYT